MKIYKNTLRDFGYNTAQKTIQQIQAAEHRLASDHFQGKFDPEHHSDRFFFVTIRNPQKLFFERASDTIFLITAGYDGRDWKALLKGLEKYADQQIARSRKTRETRAQKDSRPL